MITNTNNPTNSAEYANGLDITDYFLRCERFDWFYSYSDDHRVWSSGNAGEAKLRAEAKGNLIKQKIFDDWARHHFSGESFGTPKAKQPELKDYLN